MYLQYYAIAFFVFCFLDNKNWYTWAILSAMCILLKCNAALFDVSMDARYTVRCVIIFLSAVFIMKDYKKFSGYQSFILLLLLYANISMYTDKSNSNYFYANFEVIIYGLVCCQFIAVIPGLWRCISDIYSNTLSNFKNKKLVDRA